MNVPISNQKQWQEVLRRQSLVNAKRWLDLVESSDNPPSLVMADYDNLLRALETALQSSETFDLAYHLVQALYSIIFGYADWDRWLTYLEKTLAMSRQLQRQIEQVRLLEQIGDILHYTGNLQRAEELYKEGIGQYRHFNDLASYARTLGKLAIVYDLQGKTAESIALCRKGLAIAESTEDDWVIAQANWNLSHIYRRTRNWIPGLEAAQRAYAYYRKLDRPQSATKALLNIVAIWAELGRWEEVDRVSVELMETLVASGDVRTLSQLKNNLGVVAYNQGNYQAAESAWQEALRLHSQIQEPTELAGLCNNLGMVYTKMGEWKAAQEMLQRAITLYEKLGDVYNWANSLDNMADLYDAQQDMVAYRHTLAVAIAGLQTIDSTPHAEQLLADMLKRLDSLGSKT
jgi:tetratricopeptide (TPR) repeat protein